jgi:hypothetical protein
MGAQGSATLNFGSTPIDEATIAVTGQGGIVSGSHVEAFFMRETSADNGVEEHEAMAIYCPLTVGSIVAGTGFTIFATMLAGYATGQFAVRWVWN